MLLARSLLAVVLLGWGCGLPADPPATSDAAAPPPAAPAAVPAEALPCLLVESGAGPEGTVPVRAETVVDGLEVPWGLAFLPGGDLLVTERPGRLRLVEDGRLVPGPVATVETGASAEGGLLGLALHPAFAENRLFYVYVTAAEDGRTTNRVERWRLAEDARSATRERVILDGLPAARFHNGGRLRIGPDGLLYVGTGDARDPDLSQDPESLAGKLLRLTLDGAVPPDNPFPGNPAYLLGLRNTQGFDWPGDGSTIWVTDHGPSGDLGRRGHDEVNVAQAGDNLGWPTIYGCEEEGGLVTPSLTWEQAVPPGGAARYTGTAIPEWQGDLLVGVLGARHLHRVQIEGERVVGHEVYFGGADGYGRLREVTMGPDGHLYVTTSNCDGRGSCPPDGDKILRITR